MENNNLQIAPAELKAIADIVAKDQAAIDKAYAEGLYIGGVRYVLTRVDDDIYARAVGYVPNLPLKL
jgi:profilin